MVATVIMLVVFHYVRKGIRFIRRFTTGGIGDEDLKRTSGKYYTRTNSDGVTIIDHRDPDTVNKKIFAQDEGEYVDFKEV